MTNQFEHLSAENRLHRLAQQSIEEYDAWAAEVAAKNLAEHTQASEPTQEERWIAAGCPVGL